MGGCGGINWDKHNRTMRGVHGMTLEPKYPRYNKSFTSKTQMDIIEKLMNELREHGVCIDKDFGSIIAGDYKRDSYAAHLMIRGLNALKVKYGLPVGFSVVYINLCKDKATGKRIKYRTAKRFTPPVGYDFLGELKRIRVWDDGREESY